MNVASLLAANGIKIASTAPGKYSTTCPRCSAQRQRRRQEPEGQTEMEIRV
jgi:hypothetical protein